MKRLYAQWIDRWERKLATRDTNRVVRPFEWGLDWLTGEQANGNSGELLAAHVDHALANSEHFFSYSTPRDFRLADEVLTFTSHLDTPYPENNRVSARFFATDSGSRAVLV